jgi:hypothetical protein
VTSFGSSAVFLADELASREAETSLTFVYFIGHRWVVKQNNEVFPMFP